MNNENLELIGSTMILGKQINVYGTIENPLFLSKDVANWIEHSNVTMMMKSVDGEEVIKVRPKHSLGLLTSNNEYNFLTEDGLYEICMQSRKPIAKQMKKEIKNYLKSIRLTGAAIVDEQKTVDYYFASFSDDLKVEMFNELYKRNKELQASYDTLINSKNLMDINTVAKELKIGEYTLFDYLRNKKIFFFNNQGNNVPYERFRKEEKFVVKETLCRDGQYRSVTYSTKKGLDYIRKLLAKDNYYGIGVVL